MGTTSHISSNPWVKHWNYCYLPCRISLQSNLDYPVSVRNDNYLKRMIIIIILHYYLKRNEVEASAVTDSEIFKTKNNTLFCKGEKYCKHSLPNNGTQWNCCFVTKLIVHISNNLSHLIFGQIKKIVHVFDGPGYLSWPLIIVWVDN